MKKPSLLTSRSLFFVTAFFLLVFVFGSGCKKDSDQPSGNYYVKFTIDGVAKEFSGNTLAEFTSSDYQVTMVALKDALNGSSNSMSIALYSDNPFATNTSYTEANTSSGYPGASLVYYDELGNLTTSLNTTSATDTKVTVTLTSLTSSYVKGTFSGNLYDEAFSPAVHTVTNGSFYVKREQ